jgi:hypothetical protein
MTYAAVDCTYAVVTLSSFPLYGTGPYRYIIYPGVEGGIGGEVERRCLLTRCAFDCKQNRLRHRVESRLAVVEVLRKNILKDY